MDFPIIQNELLNIFELWEDYEVNLISLEQQKKIPNKQDKSVDLDILVSSVLVILPIKMMFESLKNFLEKYFEMVSKRELKITFDNEESIEVKGYSEKEIEKLLSMLIVD